MPVQVENDDFDARLAVTLATVLESGAFADLTLVCGDDDGDAAVEFRAHKLVLAAFCPRLHFADISAVHVGCSAAVVRAFLEFVYLGSSALSDVDHVEPFKRLAEKFGVVIEADSFDFESVIPAPDLLKDEPSTDFTSAVASKKRRAANRRRNTSAGGTQGDVEKKKRKTVYAGDYKFACPACPSSYRAKKGLVQHIAARHPHVNVQSLRCDAAPYKCDLCGKGHSLQVWLDLHVWDCHRETAKPANDRTSGGEEYGCPKCDKLYPTRRLLSHHEMGHRKSSIKTEKFLCDVCPAAFNHKSTLQKHRTKQHLGLARVVQCTECGKEVAKESLKGHMAYIHAKERPHSCGVCGKGFPLADRLALHVRIVHEKVRAFPCEHCNHRASGSSNLRKHLKNVHNVIPPKKIAALV